MKGCVNADTIFSLQRSSLFALEQDLLYMAVWKAQVMFPWIL